MRKVLFKKWIPKQFIEGKPPITGCVVIYKKDTNCWSDFIYEGVFHQWGNAYEEYETGPANYTVGIIETEDGSIVEILPSNMKFISN